MPTKWVTVPAKSCTTRQQVALDLVSSAGDGVLLWHVEDAIFTRRMDSNLNNSSANAWNRLPIDGRTSCLNQAQLVADFARPVPGTAVEGTFRFPQRKSFSAVASGRNKVFGWLASGRNP